MIKYQFMMDIIGHLAVLLNIRIDMPNILKSFPVLTLVILVACGSRQTDKNDPCANFESIKKSGFINHVGWKISPRDGSSTKSVYYFEYYCLHEDSSRFEHNTEGKEYLPSKYEVLSLAVADKEGVQGLTHPTDSIYVLLSKHLGIPVSSTPDSIHSLINDFFALNVESFISYPWTDGIVSFNFKNGNILYFPSEVHKDNEILKEYHSLEKNWYCKSRD